MDRPASIAQEGPTVKVQSESALLCTLYTLWKCAWHIKEKSPCSQVSFAPATDSYRYINANSLMIATTVKAVRPPDLHIAPFYLSGCDSSNWLFLTVEWADCQWYDLQTQH